MKSGKAHVEEEFYEDSPPEALTGTPPHDVGSGELGGALVQLCAMLTSTLILLSEADEHEFRAVANRLAAFLNLARQVEDALPRRRQPLGFRVQSPKRLVDAKQQAFRQKRKRRRVS